MSISFSVLLFDSVNDSVIDNLINVPLTCVLFDVYFKRKLLLEYIDGIYGSYKNMINMTFYFN